jgi:hypothetical protein
MGNGRQRCWNSGRQRSCTRHDDLRPRRLGAPPPPTATDRSLLPPFRCTSSPPGQLVRRSGHWWWSSMTELGFVAEQRGPGTPHLVGCEPGRGVHARRRSAPHPAAVGVHRQPTQHGPLGSAQELPAPVDHRQQGLLVCGGAPRSPRPWSGAGRAGQRREHPDLPRHSRGRPAPFPRGRRNHLELTRTTLFRSGAIALNYRPVSTEASTLHIES